MNIRKFIFNPIQVNTYIVSDDTRETVIIDAGCLDLRESEIIIDFIETRDLVPVAILSTHGHVDHVCGNIFLKQKYDVPVMIHQKDLNLLRSAKAYGQIFGMYIENPPEPDKLIDEGNVLNFGNSVLKVIHSPGHSPGSVVFYSDKDKVLFSGDVIFNGSIGRTDLPGGSYQTIIKSIKEKILLLPGDTIIYPGHGEETTVRHETGTNPFLQEGY